MLNFLFKKRLNLRLNIASIFRNNENYLINHWSKVQNLPNMELLAKKM